MLDEGPIESRTFPEWNMAYHEPAEKNGRQFVNNLIILAELSDKNSDALKTFWWEVRKVLLGG